jgi:hypothetical protein
MSVAAQTTTLNMNATKLLQFENNTAYGALPNGMTYWWIDATNNTPNNGPGSVIKNFTVWNNYQWGIWAYQSQNLTIDGFTNIGDAKLMAAGSGAIGFHVEDYYENNLTITNSDFENLSIGAEAPVFTDGTTTTISNSYFSNLTDVWVYSVFTSGSSSDWLPPVKTVLSNDRFDLTVPSSIAIDMEYYDNGYSRNLVQRDQVFVYNYNGVVGDNFQVFFYQQATDFVVPVTQGGTTGAPVAGLTNAQCWAEYGIAIAGEVAPSTAKTRAGINGLVNPI